MSFLMAPHLTGRRGAPFSIEGGVCTFVGENRVCTFLTSAQMIVTGEGLIDYLIVGGGGGNNNVPSYGGGGAGGMVVRNNVIVTAGTYNVTVGAGVRGHGENSSILNVIGDTQLNDLSIATGGGSPFPTPEFPDGGPQPAPHRNGGSGCGGVPPFPGEGTVGQGNDGGNGARSGEGASFGGGGGAGGIGGNSSSPPRRSPGTRAGGTGGVGLENNFRDGTNVFYAGGGTGNASSEGQFYASDPPAQGGGGAGGGAGGAGQPNTGGGGAGGTGGSGIVVVRYTPL